MASKDSTELGINERYPLGDYSFRIERSAGTSPNYDKIEAICTKGGKNARKSIQIPSSTQLLGWYVEANEDTASVYATFQPSDGGILPHPIPTKYGNTYASQKSGSQIQETYATIPGSAQSFGAVNGGTITWYTVDSSPFTVYREIHTGSSISHNSSSSSTIIVNDKPVCVVAVPSSASNLISADTPLVNGTANNYDLYSIVYGDPGPEQKLIGRFAIDLEDAGGVGPGSDWVDPGDYDPDWEEGDPTHTLYVEVTGALSGRHNDPIVDPSYSYIPSDKDTVKDYGCGGDGGHGGGGGAGASTVVVHKFATNQANSKEVTAIARRHGYGSGGGKGGKGGDGCILVYY